MARGGEAEAPLAQPAEAARQHGLAALQQIRPQLVDHHEDDQGRWLGTESPGPAAGGPRGRARLDKERGAPVSSPPMLHRSLARLGAAAALALITATPAHAQLDRSGYGVQPSDQIITDFYTAGGEPLASVRGERLVDREGNIFLPFVGTVYVQGLDAVEIRELLTQRFSPFYNDPVITVNVQLHVNVTGVVPGPGHYLLDPTSTTVDALAQAGGAGGEVTVGNNVAGNPGAVRLLRGGETIVLDLRPESPDPEVFEMRIQSGDWIHVPPFPRSRVRDDIQFLGSVLSLFTSVVAAIVIISR